MHETAIATSIERALGQDYRSRGLRVWIAPGRVRVTRHDDVIAIVDRDAVYPGGESRGHAYHTPEAAASIVKHLEATK